MKKNKIKEIKIVDRQIGGAPFGNPDGQWSYSILIMDMTDGKNRMDGSK